MIVIEGTNPVHLQRIKDINTLEPLWLCKNTVYNSNGNIVGKFKDGIIKIFIK